MHSTDLLLLLLLLLLLHDGKRVVMLCRWENNHRPGITLVTQQIHTLQQLAVIIRCGV